MTERPAPINQALGEALFLTPERLVRGDWIGHIPFAFFLMEKWRPALVVELGVFHGDSFCAMCQAAQHCRLPTRIVGIDSWEGDIHTGCYPEEVYEDLRRHHEPRYGSFSQMERGTFDSKLGLFNDGSIDVLHIDGEHTYEGVRHDYEAWLPKVRPGGIILFHDTDVFGRPEFGVFRLWDEIARDRPSLRFNHCNGLGVLLNGPGQGLQEPFPALLDPSSAEAAGWKALFATLGARISLMWEAVQLRNEAAAAQLRLKGEIEELTGRIQGLEEKLVNFRGMIERRDQKITHLNEKLAKRAAGDVRSQG